MFYSLTSPEYIYVRTCSITITYSLQSYIYRQLGEYKDYVTNKSAPEGCIAEAYIAHECVTYMKLYLGASLGAPQAMEEHAPRFNLSIVSSDVEVGGVRLSAEYAFAPGYVI